ncbi:MAG: SMP-30/gluconolactonase/LRE family protein [candidate division KSB1 bacterium]|nr:SMP-30/gluconolactonase/LRE family protein [candidate division KSB1 bacterium]MDZ7341717.1 SMP-30/gluconolactonase/LRE family protein [candidate division KSB1 bacterium]
MSKFNQSASYLLITLALIFLISPVGLTQLPTRDADISAAAKFLLVASGMNFPEGPAWNGDQALFVSNCYGGWISKIEGASSTVFLAASNDPFTFEKTNGLTFFKDGSLFACDFGRGAILRIQPDGKSAIYADGYQGKRFNRPNDLAFDPHGNLYFTDPNAYRTTNPDGVIYRVDGQTRQVTPAAKNLAFPNGLAFSADGSYLYVCESARQQIFRFRVSADGTLSHKELFISLPGGDPDGINFDREGNLYVAHFGGGAIYVIAANRTIKAKLPAPGKKPSNVEFGGPDLRTLYITEVETNAVYQMQVEIPGLPLFCRAMPARE